MSQPGFQRNLIHLRHKLAFLVFFALLAGWGSAGAEVAVPPLSGRVVDTAGVVDLDTRGRLERLLADFERQTSNQIAVLVIPSLEGAADEDFAIKVARTWGLGTQDRNNGVLILVVTQDRRIRIEVGRGLEGALPDGLCGRIIRDEMAPMLTRGSEQWGKAVEAGVLAVMKASKGEYSGAGGTKKKKGVPWPVIVIAGLIGLGVVGAMTKKWVSGGLGGVAGGAVGAFALGNPLLGVLCGLGGLGAGLLLPWLFSSAREHSASSGGWGSSGGFGSWGGGSSWGGGGGSSWSDGGGSSWDSGGFSGGGGSFDGGGSSGSF